MTPVDLSQYDNSWYQPGGSFVKRSLWFFLGAPLVRAAWIPSSTLRVKLLRLFGARIGAGVVIKPSVEIKYPWHLEIGDHVWVGEHVWIDNLTTVRIGSHCCLSQGAYFCTGNHDWTDPHFGLIVKPITLGNAAWAGAKSILTPGSVLGEGAIAAAGAVIVGSVPAYEIYAGNPAVFTKRRMIRGVADGLDTIESVRRDQPNDPTSHSEPAMRADAGA